MSHFKEIRQLQIFHFSKHQEHVSKKEKASPKNLLVAVYHYFKTSTKAWRRGVHFHLPANLEKHQAVYSNNICPIFKKWDTFYFVER
jgi:hypothetical protein